MASLAQPRQRPTRVQPMLMVQSNEPVAMVHEPVAMVHEPRAVVQLGLIARPRPRAMEQPMPR